MGRGTKTLLSPAGVDRRQVGYYSTPCFVAEFLAQQMMSMKPNARRALDPCVGEEELALPLVRRGVAVDSLDIANYLDNYTSRFRQQDFFDYYANWKSGANQPLGYDLYIANPPYNCHEADYVRAKKPFLQELFADVGVANVYAMFVSALVDLAQPGALIGLVTHDSFLTARMHRALRRKLLAECAIRLLILCPTDLFRNQQADVRSCIVILEKGQQRQNEILSAGRPASSAELARILRHRTFKLCTLEEIVLDDERDFDEIVVACPPEVKELFRGERLGEIATCITGVSTGEDRKYLSPVRCAPYTVPFYKNPGTRRFYSDPDAYLHERYLELSDSVSNFIARNRDYLGRRVLFALRWVCLSVPATCRLALHSV